MTELPDESATPPTPSEASRPGVPAWRLGKPDAFLAADAATARTAVQEIAGPDDIGPHLGVRSEGIRCVTHLFESKKSGYPGWVWFATLSRVARGKGATVNEVGLLPTNDSVLAPPWVPWSDRVRPEDREHEEQQRIAAGHGAAGSDAETGADETVAEDAAENSHGPHEDAVPTEAGPADLAGTEAVDQLDDEAHDQDSN